MPSSSPRTMGPSHRRPVRAATGSGLKYPTPGLAFQSATSSGWPSRLFRWKTSLPRPTKGPDWALPLPGPWLNCMAENLTLYLRSRKGPLSASRCRRPAPTALRSRSLLNPSFVSPSLGCPRNKPIVRRIRPRSVIVSAALVFCQRLDRLLFRNERLENVP